MSRVIRKNEIETQIQYALDTQTKDENCIYFHKQAGAVSIVSHREFITELDRWKTAGQIKSFINLFFNTRIATTMLVRLVYFVLNIWFLDTFIILLINNRAILF